LENINYKPIGIIHTPFETPENMPIQNAGANGIKGTIEIYPEYAEGLKDIEGFSHLILLYHLHQVNHYSLQVIPFLDTIEHGIFATRSPVRPNAIGLTIVKLIELKGSMLTIEGIDMLTQTPLLDIKPYLPQVDALHDVRIGWFEGKIEKCESKRSDKRFIKSK
jgi:tRNA-Thr(GGU) m(6)t(6)A37 methyltransferase TsaA